MKNNIIDFVMGTLRFHYIYDLKLETAKNFCKIILDGEGIEYQEEDFKGVSLLRSENINAIEIVKRYAEMYKGIYSESDIEKAEEMNKVLFSCNRILNSMHSFDNSFNGKDTEMEPQQKNLMNIYNSKEIEENPFTISFNDNVPKEVQEEVMRRISSIYEEVNAEMKIGQGR